MKLANPYFSFWAVLEGVVRLTWGRRSLIVDNGSAVLIPAGLLRRHEFRRGSRIVSFSFRTNWPDGSPVFTAEDVLPVSGKDAMTLLRVVRPLVRGAAAMSGTAALLARTGRVYDAVARILDWAGQHGGRWIFPSERDPRLERVLQDLRGNPRAGSLPVARWKSLSGLGHVQLVRLARRDLGHGLRAERDRVLLAEIHSAIRHSPESFKEIAHRLGFSDAARFSHWVRRIAGLNPRRLREAWAGHP